MRKAQSPLMTQSDDKSANQCRRDYIAVVQFTNNLPDVPCNPKFMSIQKNLNRFIDYEANEFLTKQKRPLLCEWDAGVDLESVDIKTYEICEPPAELHWKDKLLVEDETQIDKEKSRSETHAIPVAFMRNKKQHSSTRVKGTAKSRVETKIGYNLEKRGEIKIKQSREMQIEAIEKTFEDIKKPYTKHHTKPDVYAVDEFYILPDFKHFNMSLVQVDFSVYPQPQNMPENLAESAMRFSQICKAGMNGYLGHFTPTIETLDKLFDSMSLECNEDEPGILYKYTLDREYSNSYRIAHDEFYFRLIPDQGIMYCPLSEEKFVLSRLRKPDHKGMVELHLKTRLPNTEEISDVTKKMLRLLKKSTVEAIERDYASEYKDAELVEDEEVNEIYEEEESSSESTDSSGSSDEYEPPKKSSHVTAAYYGSSLPEKPKSNYSQPKVMKIKESPVPTNPHNSTRVEKFIQHFSEISNEMSTESAKFTKFEPKPTGKSYFRLRLSYLMNIFRTRPITTVVASVGVYLIAFNVGMRWWKGSDHPVNRLQWQLMKADGRLPHDMQKKEDVIKAYYTSRIYDRADSFPQVMIKE